MFTGIIEEVGHVLAVDDLGGGKRLSIQTSFVEEVRPEESIAVNGVCLTVVEKTSSGFTAEVVEETLRKTNLGQLQVGDAVNLERALRMGERLNGHLVQGHVDTTAEVVCIIPQQVGRLFTIRYDPSFASFLIPTGSITVDGISLTVAQLSGSSFTVAIIPYTYEHTTVRNWTVGRMVNLEFDMVGKYVLRHLEQRLEHMPEVLSKILGSSF